MHIGFSNAAVVTIGSLFIVIGAIDKSHVVDWVARKAFGSSGSDTFGKIRIYVLCFALSCFLNNTPLVALLMPVVKDWGMFYIPLLFLFLYNLFS